MITTASFVVLAADSSRPEVYVSSTLLGIGIGFAFASLANLIIEAVPPWQTGVATGVNTIVRTIGGAVGAEVGASVLAAHLVAGEPEKRGYTITFVICAAVVFAGVIASLAVPRATGGRVRRRTSVSTRDATFAPLEAGADE